MTIRQMQRADLDIVLDWARQEGWNPGIEDASVFFSTDPAGFFVQEIDDQLISGISVVNLSPDVAFLGLYITKPEFRGKGFGIALWEAALSHAGDRSVGLEGVMDKVENYASSGFEPAGRTVRFCGALPQQEAAATHSAVELDDLIAADGRYNGFIRTRFASVWFTDTDTRHTVAVDAQNFATARQCHDGVKIGPLYAHSQGALEGLLYAIDRKFPGQSVTIDIPDVSDALAEFMSGLGLDPAFETVRMFNKRPPVPDYPKYAALATLELG